VVFIFSETEALDTSCHCCSYGFCPSGGGIFEELGVHPQHHLFEGTIEGSDILFQRHPAMKHICSVSGQNELAMEKPKSYSRHGYYTSLDEDFAFDQPNGFHRNS